MLINGTTQLIGILGHPVKHSLSPVMHNTAFQEYGLDFCYVPLGVRPEDLSEAMKALRIFNFKGANVTLPHKENVIPFLDEISDLSRVIGAVNTITQDQGRLLGTTTDPIGFREGFHEAGLSFKGKSIAIIGNGGTARTIAFTLRLMEEAERVTLVARNAEKSHTICREVWEKTNKQVDAVSLESYPSQAAEFDVVVNTTPVGMYPNLAESPLSQDALHEGQIIYDIVYSPEHTQLLKLAKQKGLMGVGGLGMLIYQGIASFKLWTGITPDPRLYYNSVRKQLRRNFLSKQKMVATPSAP